MTTLRLVGSPWRTDTFRRLATRLENIVGSKTAKQFEPLKILSVGDLMRHLPRRYFSGTELSDLSALREGEEVAVLAEGGCSPWECCAITVWVTDSTSVLAIMAAICFCIFVWL